MVMINSDTKFKMVQNEKYSSVSMYGQIQHQTYPIIISQLPYQVSTLTTTSCSSKSSIGTTLTYAVLSENFKNWHV